MGNEIAKRDSLGRFKPGVSGNPAGRPPLTVEGEYMTVARTTVPIERWGRILDRHATQAERGNVHSLNALIKLLGLDVVKVEQNNQGALEIVVRYVRDSAEGTSPEPADGQGQQDEVQGT